MIWALRTFVSKVFWKLAFTIQPDTIKTPHIADYDWFIIPTGPLNGARMFLDRNNSGQRSMSTGTFDGFMFEALASVGIALEKKTVWDVGAYIGYHTLAFAALVGESGCVVAFEPSPHNLTRLTQQLEANPELARRVRVEPYALADQAGQQTFRTSSIELDADIGHLESSGLTSERIAPAVYAKLDTITVTVKTIDQLLEEGYAIPDLIKIDVEGAERLVLEGARKVLQTAHPSLFIEVHNISAMFDVQNILLHHGYETTLVEDPAHKSSSRIHLWASNSMGHDR